VLRFHFRSSEHEINMVKHMDRTFRSLIETMGGKVTSPAFPADASKAVSPGGFIIHEAGTVKMGTDKSNSVLNQYSQTHEAPNVLVVDAGPFNSNPDKNVTLTIVANSWRASEHIAEEMRKGNV